MSETRNDEHHDVTLSPADAQSLDRLLEHGLDPRALGDAPLDRLLSLLGTPAATEDRALIDAAFIRALRAADPAPAALTPRDAEALDAWVMHAYDASRAPGSLRDRAQRHAALASLITAAPITAASRADLTDRTLASVQAAIAADEDRLRVRPSVWSRFRLADLVSAAAMLLIAGSVALPSLSAIRARQNTLACASNMQATASAMGLYAGANHESLPMATAGLSGRWIDVGTTPERSNSANLFTLVRTDHATLDTLACAGNPSAARGQPGPAQVDWRSLPEVSYSYQSMAGPRPAWRSDLNQPATVVLADRSPVVIRSVTHRTIDPYAGSPNHRERGQHTLSNDGSSHWSTSPVLDNGDNIWLPRDIERVLQALVSGQSIIDGDERPGGPGDVFLGP